MTMSDRVPDTTPLERGRAAMTRGDWQAARDLFEAALKVLESAEALEGLGAASWWLEDPDETFAARERAYRLYRDSGDAASAGRLATALAADHLYFRGEEALANGWLATAHGLLDPLPPLAEQGWLAVLEAEVSVLGGNDADGARVSAREATELGRSLGSVDLEMAGIAVEGLALVSAGEVAEGMRRLDQSAAAIVAGDMRDPHAIGDASCYLIYACHKVRDFQRAAEWCRRIMDFCKEWRYQPLFGVCRNHYAGVLISRGKWDEAEAELAAAAEQLDVTRPPLAAEGVARLGELRRRQGRLDEAEQIFGEVDFLPEAQVGRAALALDRQEPAEAVEWAERFLRGMPPSARTDRVPALEILAGAYADLGEGGAASAAAAELQELAAAIGTEHVLGSASLAAGVVAEAAGDNADARRHFEDALDQFRRCGSPWEEVRARQGLARALSALGRDEATADHLAAADALLERLGASRPAPQGSGDAGNAAGLTSRELEVLRLVASGKTNREIGAELFLSHKTVARHLSNIFFKLGVSTRTAAATRAYQEGLLAE